MGTLSLVTGGVFACLIVNAGSTADRDSSFLPAAGLLKPDFFVLEFDSIAIGLRVGIIFFIIVGTAASKFKRINNKSREI
jgi:hypothetical protein